MTTLPEEVRDGFHHSGTKLDKTNKFLRRLGFVQTGGNYALALNQLKQGEELK